MTDLTPRVLFFSLHRYDHGTFYPGSSDADSSCVGGPGAEGYNINVAWNDAKMGDAEYMSAFHNVLLPVAYEVMTARWSRWAGEEIGEEGRGEGRKRRGGGGEEEERGGRGEEGERREGGGEGGRRRGRRGRRGV